MKVEKEIRHRKPDDTGANFDEKTIPEYVHDLWYGIPPVIQSRRPIVPVPKHKLNKDYVAKVGDEVVAVCSDKERLRKFMEMQNVTTRK